MKQVIPILFLSAILLTGCKVITTKGKSSTAEQIQRQNIEQVTYAKSTNNVARINAIAELAYGTSYSLSKLNEPPKEVEIAKELNERVVSIAGSPHIDKIKEMQETIDLLIVDKNAGLKQLAAKDKEIQSIQLISSSLLSQYDKEVRDYMSAAQQAAASADYYNEELKGYTGWFGLKAVFKGLFQFLKSSFWILGIGSVLFIILRILSMSNPIAASIFSIFNLVGSWIINVIKYVVPKAVDMAGHTATTIFQQYTGTMKKIIDGIQTLKERQKDDPNKKYTLDELLELLSKDMSTEDKNLVAEMKKEIGYN